MRIECEAPSQVQDNCAEEKTLCRKICKSLENTMNQYIEKGPFQASITNSIKYPDGYVSFCLSNKNKVIQFVIVIHVVSFPINLEGVTTVHSPRLKISILGLCSSDFWMPNLKDFRVSKVLGICIFRWN